MTLPSGWPLYKPPMLSRCVLHGVGEEWLALCLMSCVER